MRVNKTDVATEQLVRELARLMPDHSIAPVLNRLGIRSVQRPDLDPAARAQFPRRASTGSRHRAQSFSFDAQTEEYVDMLGAGIVDPAKVARVALQDAASIASLLIITEAMVAEMPKKDAPAMPSGGFDGIGY